MKKTKQEKAAEIAAMYATVANGGRMQQKHLDRWASSRGPDLSSNLSKYRAIPAPKKP